MKLMLSALLLAMLASSGQLINESTQSFRVIPIQKRETGYSNFRSLVFVTQADFDLFLTDTTLQIGWNGRREFEAALRDAKVDFSKEALVLLRHDEGSGSVQVTFEPPVLKDGKLLCEIRGKAIPPGYLGTADMANYCFAVAVTKSEVTQVELQAIEGGFSERHLPTIVLPITESQPANYPVTPPIKQSEVLDCPTVTVTCPAAGAAGNKTIKFRVNVAGGKPLGEISYGWSVSKGRISFGQGTAAIEVEVAGGDLEGGVTATVEVNGFDPNCDRVASCTRFHDPAENRSPLQYRQR